MHPLMAARAGYVEYSQDPAISPKEFLEETLKAIKRRRGLIHGSWREGSRVCALGAFGACHNGAVIPGDLATELQQYNDSMPKASPEKRRAKVIEWIEKRLKEIQ